MRLTPSHQPVLTLTVFRLGRTRLFSRFRTWLLTVRHGEPLLIVSGSDVGGADHKRALTDTDPFPSHWCHTERLKDLNLGYPIAANRIMLKSRNRLKESVNSRYWLLDRARSSAGEHFLDMEGVTGSIPVAPTNTSQKDVPRETFARLKASIPPPERKPCA